MIPYSKSSLQGEYKFAVQLQKYLLLQGNRILYVIGKGSLHASMIHLWIAYLCHTQVRNTIVIEKWDPKVLCHKIYIFLFYFIQNDQNRRTLYQKNRTKENIRGLRNSRNSQIAAFQFFLIVLFVSVARIS